MSTVLLFLPRRSITHECLCQYCKCEMLLWAQSVSCCLSCISNQSTTCWNNLQEAADVTYIQHELWVMFIPCFSVSATHIAACVRPQEYLNVSLCTIVLILQLFIEKHWTYGENWNMFCLKSTSHYSWVHAMDFLDRWFLAYTCSGFMNTSSSLAQLGVVHLS